MSRGAPHPSERSLILVEVERQVQRNWALLRGLEINTLTPKKGGEASEYRQRAFGVLRRSQDGRWRFARGMTNQGPIEADESESGSSG